MGKEMTKKWGEKLYDAGLEWGKIMGKTIFSISPFLEWEKIMGKRSKMANFPNYWNGEKEWGKNIDNGEKLLTKKGKFYHGYFYNFNFIGIIRIR